MANAAPSPEEVANEAVEAIGGLVDLGIEKAENIARKTLEKAPPKVLLTGVGVATAPKAIPQPTRFLFGVLSGTLIEQVFEGAPLGSGEEAAIRRQQEAEAVQRVALPVLAATLGTAIVPPMWDADP